MQIGKTRTHRAQLANDAVHRAQLSRGLVVWTRPGLADAPANETVGAWLARIRTGLHATPPIAGPAPGTSLGVYAQEHATTLHGDEAQAARRDELAQLRAQSACGNTGIDVLAVRSKLLQLAEDRASTLPPAPADDSGKKKETSLPRCGFDARLAWDDEPLWAWAISAAGRAMLQEEVPLDGCFPGQQHGTGPPVVCGEPKRRCKRHADWSLVRNADTEVGRELQTLYVSSLAEREQHIRALFDTPT